MPSFHLSLPGCQDLEVIRVESSLQSWGPFIHRGSSSHDHCPGQCPQALSSWLVCSPVFPFGQLRFPTFATRSVACCVPRWYVTRMPFLILPLPPLRPPSPACIPRQWVCLSVCGWVGWECGVQCRLALTFSSDFLLISNFYLSLTGNFCFSSCYKPILE